MNIETREIREEQDIPRKELLSGKWIRVPKTYTPKTPVSDADYRRLLQAEAKRLRRRAARLEARIADV